ncbi:MAG TPA: response regulator transcription factor [Phaeodactylibacter sp.]|nr:response regulator transcription factor [Phaeodactylibacter sp.]
MQPVRILLVEDDRIIADNLTEQLEEYGYRIAGHATNSDEALALFQKERPDIALLDIELNGSKLDGIELSKELHRISPLPILFLTSHDKREFVERAKQAPMMHYVLKSAPIEQLLIDLDTAFAQFYKDASTAAAQPEPPPYPDSPPPAMSGCALYSADDYFFVKQGYRHVRVEVGDIRWIKAMKYAVKIVTDTKTIVFSVKLKSFLEQVQHPDIQRTHNSWAVNSRHVVGYHRGRVMVRYQEGTEEIPLSGDWREAFLDSMPNLKAD